jgi:formamidopyrimidine-DNA glycosylase
MFELPEMVTLAQQMNKTIKGKKIKKGMLGNSPHKFVWYNRKHAEFERLTKGKRIGKAYSKGRWLFVPVEPGYVLVFGECGGKVLFHTPGSDVPQKYHLFITFTDDFFLTATTQMWGAYELYRKGDEKKRQYIKGMKRTPIDKAFTFDYFNRLIDGLTEKKSVKGILTQDQLIPGLGNAIAQDIMFKARLNPRHPADALTKAERRKLYNAVVRTVTEVIKKGGRNDESDLYGKAGKYVRLMDKNAAGKPCPSCSKKIKKIQYLGGACYFCPSCQT